ncbi:hemagglutinin repeat-containing protein [Pandoraea sp. PE-S2R-1]|uniref:hemagglutinin repeat-containing protein n=1 Tax=Pandoraea sp. PE-S2R-1 TaxID=1986994 RepID=UPI001482A140|nr:hemagglutinin repeat-containing protein [Pandoraea sp. PE-S2R-1]
MQATQTIGSTVSGDTVTIASGQDVEIVGSNVVSDGDVNISARHDVTITSAEDRQPSLNTSETTTSGIFGSGTSTTIGQRSEKDKQRRESTSQTRRVIGAVKDDICAEQVAIVESVETDASARGMACVHPASP